MALATLRAGGARADAARVLLMRYVPGGPGKDATVDAWERWLQENRPYMFYSDWGGYRWYVDPLAQARRIPTAKLRALARADKFASFAK